MSSIRRMECGTWLTYMGIPGAKPMVRGVFSARGRNISNSLHLDLLKPTTNASHTPASNMSLSLSLPQPCILCCRPMYMCCNDCQTAIFTSHPWGRTSYSLVQSVQTVRNEYLLSTSGAVPSAATEQTQYSRCILTHHAKNGGQIMMSYQAADKYIRTPTIGG